MTAQLKAGQIVLSTTFLSALAGFLDPNKKYTGDTGKWSRTILTLMERHKKEYPWLFDDFGIRRTGPTVYSAEVDRWLTSLYGAISPQGVWRGEYAGKCWLMFEEPFSATLRENARKNLDLRSIQALEGFAKTIREEELLDFEEK